MYRILLNNDYSGLILNMKKKNKKTLVNEIFTNVSNKYDYMNDIMSFGMHRIWKYKICRMIPNLNSKIIDVAGGTGDIAIIMNKYSSYTNYTPSITICDINHSMLRICQEKIINNNLFNNINIVLADAEQLPFADNSFDYYIIAFGIRNFSSIKKGLAEAYRVLKPTGKFLCLEFSKVGDEYSLVKSIYSFYLDYFIPKLGQLVASNKSAYDYLAESIKLFLNQEDMKTLIQSIGFKNVGYQNLTFGVAANYYGYKN